MADGDIPKARVNPDTHHEEQGAITINWNTNTMIVIQREVDVNGDSVGKENIHETFMDRPPRDGTSTEFTDLIAKINSEKNIELTIKNAIVAKRAI